MSAPQDVLEAVADTLGQVDGLRIHSYTPGSVAPPAAIVEIASITAPSTFGSFANYQIRVILLVQIGDNRSSQVRTQEFIDPTGAASSSVFAALLDHDPASSVRFEGPGLVPHGGQDYSGGIFTLDIHA